MKNRRMRPRRRKSYWVRGNRDIRKKRSKRKGRKRKRKNGRE